MGRPAALLAVAALAAACNTGFEPQYRVTDLRILGVRAEVVGGSSAADPSPSDTVRLEALVANPLGRAGLRVRWIACVPREAAVPPCLEPELLKEPDRLAGAPGAFELPAGPGTGERPPELALPALPPEARQGLDLALQAARDLAAREPTYRCRLYVEIPIVVIADAEGRREVAVKRLRLVPPPPYDAYVPNVHPVIVDVRRAPSDPDACLGGTSVAPDGFSPGRTVLCGVGDAPGTYLVCGPDGNAGTAHERQSWQWFTTGGTFTEFDDGVGNATGRSVDFERPSEPFTLWVVLRDGRGGERWWTETVASAP